MLYQFFFLYLWFFLCKFTVVENKNVYCNFYQDQICKIEKFWLKIFVLYNSNFWLIINSFKFLVFCQFKSDMKLFLLFLRENFVYVEYEIYRLFSYQIAELWKVLVDVDIQI